MLYYIDIVMCIDKTGAMNSIISQIKEQALNLYDLIVSNLDIEIKLRVKFMFIGDFLYDNDPLIESKFFILNDEKEEMRVFLNNIYVGGGGDLQEDQLEALSLAINTDWNKGEEPFGRYHRQVILLITDATAHPLRTNEASPLYPTSNIPNDLDELKIWWDNFIPSRTKRLILVSPDEYPWNEINTWDYTHHISVELNNACSEINFNDIITILIKTL